MIVLGIQRGHDAGICLIKNGVIACTVEAERVLRIKHAKGASSIPACASIAFRQTGIHPKDVDLVVIADNNRDNIEAGDHYHRPFIHEGNLLSQLGTVGKLRVAGGEIGVPGLRMNVPVMATCHHACHAAHAIYMSGFSNCLTYVYDGYGSCCGSIGYSYSGDKISRIEESKDRILVGWRYQLMAQFVKDIDKDTTDHLDFSGKIMGLCGYGTPVPDAVYSLKSWLKKDYDDYVKAWDANTIWFPGLINESGFTRNSTNAQSPEFLALIASLQEAINQVLIEEISDIQRDYPFKKLALSGGCALNILANDALQKSSLFEEIFIPPNPGDSGIATGAAVIGAAFLEAQPFHFPAVPIAEKRNPYKGPRLLDKDYRPTSSSIPAMADIIPTLDSIVDCLAEKGIVGFINGPMEIGPRALGRRSLLADPGIHDMKDLLNNKIKRREWWRPFAPVARIVDAREYFDINKPCPYMIHSAKVRPAWAERLSSVTHVDGTARLQVLESEEANPELWYILTRMKDLRGYGVCLNTSLNLGGSPIMNSIDEIHQFLNSTSVNFIYADGTVYRRQADRT